MIGRNLTHVIDNFDAMGWKATFTIKVEPRGLIIEFQIKWRVPDTFWIESDQLHTEGEGKTITIGSAFGLPWARITPYPVPDEPKVETFSPN
jgi:hypothetical protein